jgi:hypothetical protein
MECPRKYQLTIIQGWRKTEESVHLKFGSIFASSMEAYFHARAQGGDHEDALDVAVDHVLRESYGWNPDNSPKKNRDTLLRTVIWYFEEYKDDPAQIIHLANGRPATELSFKFESGIASPFGTEYLLCGHLDRVVDYAGDLFVMDQKTTGGGLGAFYFSQYDLDNQMSQYTLAGQVVYNLPLAGVIIDAASILVGQTTFGRGFTMRSKGQLEEWLVNTELHLRNVERYADANQWPMNLKSCGNYGGCVFKDICKKDPEMRERFLETYFEKRFWNPLVPR